MSHPSHTPHSAHGHDGHDAHGHDDHDDVGYHATVKGYAIGFILSVILTAIPFWLVMGKVLPSTELTAYVILGFAAVQMVVHMVYFLHLNSRVEEGWSLMSLLFSIALVVIMLAGSIWVMHNMNTNMMPQMEMGSDAARNAP